MTLRHQLYQKFLLPLLLLSALNIIGTVGYVYICNYPWLDALYMSVITLATVGFAEVHPLNDAGRIFTIFLILASLGFVAYNISLVTRLLIDGEWLRQYRLFKQQKRISVMEQHVIICGFGRNGQAAAAILAQNNLPYVIVETKELSGAEKMLHQNNIVKGDSTRDDTLLEAGITRARAIITTLPSDADNLFVVLSARQLNPVIDIISRASADSSVPKLKIAGATNVVMPDKLGGAFMATMVSNPDVQEFLSLMSLKHNDEFQVAEIIVQEACNLGQLDLWQRSGCTVLGVKQADGKYQKNPSPDYILMKNERLILMGSMEQIGRAKEIING